MRGVTRSFAAWRQPAPLHRFADKDPDLIALSELRKQNPSLRPELLFVLACTWTVVSLAGGRLAASLTEGAQADFARYGVAVALQLTGFYLLARLGIHELRPLSSVGLVRRPGLRSEIGKGLALGWAIGLAMVLPSILTGRSVLRFEFTLGALGRLASGTALLLLFAGFLQLLLAGLPMRLLVRVAGPVWSLTAVAALALLLAALSGQSTPGDYFFVVLAVSLFAVGFLRTRALWLSLGLQAGWTLSQCLLFGSPLPHTPLVSGVVFLNGRVDAPWRVGGVNGPELPAYGLFVLALALIALTHLTREYAWLYTYESPVAGGYPVEVQAPAQHAVQSMAEPPRSLIQISLASSPDASPAEPHGPPDR